MYLLPERRNHCKTRICKKTTEPEFNEMFSFDVAFINLQNRMLQVNFTFLFMHLFLNFILGIIIQKNRSFVAN